MSNIGKVELSKYASYTVIMYDDTIFYYFDKYHDNMLVFGSTDCFIGGVDDI